MRDVVYRSEVTIERERGPIRQARIPGNAGPVAFGVHGAIAEHYGVDAADYPPTATTIDYVVAAAGG